jgi:hypothetical protein
MMTKTPMRTIQTPSALVTYYEDGAYSTYPDGASYAAQPHDTGGYDAISERCGYLDRYARFGRSRWSARPIARLEYCREHEVFHHLVGAWFYGGPSPVLWALAHSSDVTPEAAALEEAMVMACQRWVRAGERPIIGGCDWDRFKREALALLDG